MRVPDRLYTTFVSGPLTEEEVSGLLMDYQGMGYVNVIDNGNFTLIYAERRHHDIPRTLANHKVIAQANDACTHLRTNFNPTADEVRMLRDFVDRAQSVNRASINFRGPNDTPSLPSP